MCTEKTAVTHTQRSEKDGCGAMYRKTNDEEKKGEAKNVWGHLPKNNSVNLFQFNVIF